VTTQGGVSALAKIESRRLRWRVRATGTIQPVEAVTLSTPQLRNAGDLVLTKIAPSGTRVREGDIVAEFDRTRSLDRAPPISSRLGPTSPRRS
jgi:multidrug efflux pump subunit AcrA (membrane-fusion protein)